MLPEHYPIEPSKILAGEYPGNPDRKIARARLLALAELGVRTFIDLTTVYDQMEPYEPLFAEIEEETGIKLHRISTPIPDMQVPDSPAKMSEILRIIQTAKETNPAVYIHCWGGIGRTGTVAGCWLRTSGLEAEAALKKVQDLYTNHMPKSKKPQFPESPQTPQQKDYIRNFNGDAGLTWAQCL